MPPIDRFIVVILAAGGNPARKPRIAPEMTLRVSVTSWIPAFARMTASRDDGAQAQNIGGASALRATETNGRAGVREYQTGAGVSTVLATRTRPGARRMASGLHDEEFKAYGGTTFKKPP